MPAKLRKGRSLASAFALGFFFLCTVINLAAQRIPAGTRIVVRNDTALSSATSRTGRYWTGTMVNDLSVREESLLAQVPKCAAELPTPSPQAG